jgi:hypothetical protein
MALLTSLWVARGLLPNQAGPSQIFPTIIYITSHLVLTAFAAWNACYQTSFWQRHRAEFILCFQILITILLYLPLRVPGAHQVLLRPPKSGKLDLASMWLAPALMARATMRYSVPLSYHRLIAWSTQIVAGLLTVMRCKELTLLTENTPYKDLLASVGGIAYYLLPMLPPRMASSSSSDITDDMTEIGACVATNLWIQQVIGVALCMSVIWAEEEVSRRKFERERGLGVGFHHHPRMAALLHLLLLPMDAIVMLHALLILMQQQSLARYLGVG